MQGKMAESEKKLQFLLSLLEYKGVAKRELARMLGMTPQSIFTYFKRDDMKLSFAQTVASKLGYELVFRLEKADAQLQSGALEIEAPVGDGGLSRLSFLRVALQQYGISRKELAEKLELHYMGVNRWFAVDDIAISYLYEIAQLYGLQVKIKAVALPPDTVK